MYLNDGSYILSEEGVTHSDNLVMAMHAIGTRKLIDILALDQLIQVWFADDSSAAGKIDKIHEWFAKLKEEGAMYSYFLKASKCKLILRTLIC